MTVAILHEGSSPKSEDQKLLKELIGRLGLNDSNVDYFPMKSKSNFFKPEFARYIELLKQIEADEITKVLFIIDADSSADDAVYGGSKNTLTKLEEMTTSLGIGGICELYIFCDPKTGNGNIEDLILSTLDEEKNTCIKNFLECSDFKAKENSKAILNGIYRIFYPESPFDFEHKNFDELKGKLSELLS